MGERVFSVLIMLAQVLIGVWLWFFYRYREKLDAKPSREEFDRLVRRVEKMEEVVQTELREAIHGLDMRSAANAGRLAQIEKAVEALPHMAETLVRVETTLTMLAGRDKS